MTFYPKGKTVRVEAPPIETEPNPGKSLAKEMLSELSKRNHGEKRQK